MSLSVVPAHWLQVGVAAAEGDGGFEAPGTEDFFWPVIGGDSSWAITRPMLVMAISVVVLVAVRGVDALAGALIGLVVAVAFFASGMFLLSRLVRSASPHAFVAVAMAVYLGQVFVLLVVIIAFKNADWVDGVALGLVALVVTIAWQVFAMIALRRARTPVYDEPSDQPGGTR